MEETATRNPGPGRGCTWPDPMAARFLVPHKRPLPRGEVTTLRKARIGAADNGTIAHDASPCLRRTRNIASRLRDADRRRITKKPWRKNCGTFCCTTGPWFSGTSQERGHGPRGRPLERSGDCARPGQCLNGVRWSVHKAFCALCLRLDVNLKLPQKHRVTRKGEGRWVIELEEDNSESIRNVPSRRSWCRRPAAVPLHPQR